MPAIKALLFSITICLGLTLSLINQHADASPITLQKGVFLVATANLHGTSFEKTVILITEHGASGAMGLAINRPTDLPLAEVLPELKDMTQVDDARIYLGGPVHPMAIVFLARAATPPDGGIHVFRDVFLGAGMAGLKSALANSSGEDKKVQTYSGYAGWMPQQLENEIARGDWTVILADPVEIFGAETETLWQRLSRKWAGRWI